MTKEAAPAARQQCECTRAPNLLVGDSLVARETGRFFSQLRPANSALAFPGARVKKDTAFHNEKDKETLKETEEEGRDQRGCSCCSTAV